MVGPSWIQAVFVSLIAVPGLVMAGIALMLAIGGVLGCIECACCRFGIVRFAPGVVAPSERGVVAT